MNNDNGSIDFEARLRLEKLEEGVKEMEKMLNDSMKSSQKETDKLQQSINNLAKGAMAFFTISKAYDFAQKIIAVRSQFQQLEIAFGTMLKSKEKANALMAQMTDLAAKTPFGLQEVSEGAKRLLAFQVPAQEVTETLRRMGDVAAGLGVPMGQLIHVYGQVKAQGKLMTNDLYQFMNAGIPIIAELSKVVGKSETEIKDMVSAGKIGFAEVQAVIKGMTDEGGLFYNLMAEQSKTLSGQLSNLEDNFANVLNEIGKATEGIASGAISSVAFLVENYQTLGKIIAGLIATYGTYKTAILVNSAIVAVNAEITKGWTIAQLAQYRGLLLLEKAQKLLNTTMLSNPFILVTTAVMGLISAYFILREATDADTEATKRHNELREEQANKVEEERNRINKLIATIQDETKSWNERNKAFLELQKTTNGVLDKYTSLNQVLREMSQVLKELNGRYETMNEGLSRDAVKNTEDTIKQKEAQIERLKAEMKTTASRDHRVALQMDINDIKRSIEADKILRKKQLKVVVKNDVANYESSLSGKSLDQIQAEKKLINEAYNLRKKQAKESISNLSMSKIDSNNPYLKYDWEELGMYNEATERQIKLKQQEKKQIHDKNELLKEQHELQVKIKNLQGKTKKDDNELAQIDSWQKRHDEVSKILESKFGVKKETPKSKATKSELPTFDYKKAAQEEARREQDFLFQKEQARINIMEDGAKKSLAIIQLDYDRQEEEIRRRTEDQMAAFIEQQKARAEAEGKWKKGQAFNEDTPEINAHRAKLQTEEQQLLASNHDYMLYQQEQVYKELLEKYQTYSEKRKTLVQKHEKELKELSKTLSDEQLEELKKQQANELNELDDAFVSKKDNYKKLFEDLRELSNKEIEEAIKEAKKLLLITNMSDEMRKSINARIKDTERMFSQKKLSEINQYSQAVRELSKAFSELGSSTGNSSLSSLGAAISNIAGQFTGLMEVMNKYKNGNISSADKVGAVAGFASNLISSIADSTRQRKEAEERYYTSVIGYQNAYNLALIEQKRIQKDLDSSFLLKDRTEQLKHEFDTIRDVGKQQEKQLELIRSKGQMKVGTGSKTDWGGVAGMTASGAITGAMIGAGPVGAAVGAVVGFIGGLFSSKKPKDVFGNLLENWPHLLKQSANGVWEIDKGQAEIAKNSGLVNEETKLMLQQYIDLENELEKSRTKIKEIVTEFAGNLAPNIQNSLVEAFKAGENAIVKMGETMDKVVENMVASLIFQSVFKDTFKKLETEMEKSMDVGGDGNWVDDFGRFYREAGAKTKQYYDALAQARDSAKTEGFNILKENAQGRQAVEKGFARMSQDTGEELNGQFRLQTQLSAEIKNAALQTANFIKEMNQSMQSNAAQQLRHLAGIEANTYKLNKMETDLAGVKTVLSDIQTKGIKIRS
jgi:putative viral A-type inclusion protein|nr:MAG TPA: tail tape measure protein [Caudoviricetes sp.]